MIRAPALLILLSAASAAASAGEPDVTVADTDFHGHKAIVLRNQTAEIVVVPAIGRVMRFGLRDGKSSTTPGPFWNHPRLGSGLSPDAEGWTNYGGDKAWPAPQSDWPKVTGRPWPPPKGFDATPYTVPANVRGRRVNMVSAVDPDYGIRVRRSITLHPRRPVMTIETTYEKLHGAPVRVGVWTITQLTSPDRLFVLLPPRRGRAFPDGYRSLMPDAPADLKIEGRMLSLIRDPARKTMIGSDGRALLWVGPDLDLLIEDTTSAPAARGGSRPTDAEGARSQIYTSPDDNPYVELELLDHPRDLRPGAKAVLRARYTLIRRSEADPSREAAKVFARP